MYRKCSEGGENAEHKSRHDRFSIIMVETDCKGFEATKLKNKLGLVPRTRLKSLSAMSGFPRRT
jgi:hypothetical protein